LKGLEWKSLLLLFAEEKVLQLRCSIVGANRLYAGKRRLSGDKTRDISRDELSNMRKEIVRYKDLVVEFTMSNHVLKKISKGLS